MINSARLLHQIYCLYRSIVVRACLVLSFMAFVSMPLAAYGQSAGEYDGVNYLPTRAFVPMVEDLPQLAQQAYDMGVYKDSLRFYKRLATFDETTSQLGIAKNYERIGYYNKALKELGNLHLKDTAIREQASILRGHLLLTLAEVYQQQKEVKKAEDLLRTFFTEHNDQRTHPRYTYLMRQQAQLSGASAVPSEMPTQPLRIGLLLPMSGNMEHLGKSMQQAALLALYEQSSDYIEIYPEDTKGTPEGALAAFERALDSGVDIVLGPLLANNVRAIASFADAARRPILAYSSDRTVAEERGVRLFSIIPTEQATLMAKYAVENGLRSFAALLPDNLYGREMLEAFEAELTRLGITMDRHAFYNPKSPDLTKPIRYLTRMQESEKALKEELQELEEQHEKLAGAMDDEDIARLAELRKAKAKPDIRYQALFVPASATSMALISSQLAFFDSDGTQVQLLGSNQWDSPNLLRNAERYLQNAIYPASPKAADRGFTKRFTNTVRKAPHPLAALTYDSIVLLSFLAQQGLNSGHGLEFYLKQTIGFNGVTGPYQFTEQDTLRHGYSIMQIKQKRGGKMSVREVSSPPYLLPSVQTPIASNNTSRRKESTNERRGFFGSIFGN